MLHISDEGFDLNAYRTAAEQVLPLPYCLFFNSYARVLAPRWLETYANASARLGDNAVIGATGSWTSIDTDVPFPSPHLRTNAIFIRRELYLAFDNPLDSKEACVRFESGSNSLSQSIARSGGHVAMVGRSGQVVPPGDWPESRIYYASDQEELLVADNRSHGYQIAKPRSRLRLFGKQRGARLGPALWSDPGCSARWSIGSGNAASRCRSKTGICQPAVIRLR